MGKLDGKVALVTGGARGQGRSHALALAREGAPAIIVCDIADQITTVPYAMGSAEQLEETVKLVEDLDRRCVALKADVRDANQVQAVVDAGLAEFGAIDILLANSRHHVAAADLADARRRLARHDRCQPHWCLLLDPGCPAVHDREIAEARADRGDRVPGRPDRVQNLGHYVASKWGVIGLVKAVALEVAANGITVNAVCPITSTPT